MVSDFNSTTVYLSVLDELNKSSSVIPRVMNMLEDFVRLIYKSDLENRYSKPMVWVGVYIASASLYCILAMVADLLYGLKSRKLWFPCRYFTINAFSLAVIAIAMKLPVDLTCPMPGVVDRVAKLGSVAFMCTMMANLAPCLATMDKKALLANITALGVLVITLVVNVCIQIQTGVVESCGEDTVSDIKFTVSNGCDDSLFWVLNNISYSTIATIYVTVLLMLLLIHASSSLAILKFKQIIEPKYEEGHKRASRYIEQSNAELLTVEELEQHVRNYWIMAGSGNPQFIIACSATTTASGVLCALTAILQALTMGWTIEDIKNGNYGSDYDWSMPLILILQFLGVVLGTIAPLSRCFALLSFKVTIESISNRMKVRKVESYWTQKLYEWEDGSTLFPFRSYKRNVLLKNMKSLILYFCIKLQNGVVRICKIISLIPFFYMICFLYCFRFLKWFGQAVWNLIGSRKEAQDGTEHGMADREGTPPPSIGTVQKPLDVENMEKNPYVLQLDEDEMELAERTLKDLSMSLDRLIQKSEKKQPKNLMNLIREKSTIGFQGVKTSGNNDRDCSSLEVVTLTTIAVTLCEIEKVEVDGFLKSVREGLEYVTLVEKNLNATADYVSIQKAAERLWQEVDVCHKWLGINLKDIAQEITTSKDDATLQRVQFFLEKSNDKIKLGVGRTHGGTPNGDSEFTDICASSMSRITQIIIDDQKESHKKSFDDLISSRIANVMVACLTNLPKVIAMKCHTSVIEKREASVRAAAKLLGETKEMIEMIKTLQNPSRNDRSS